MTTYNDQWAGIRRLQFRQFDPDNPGYLLPGGVWDVDDNALAAGGYNTKYKDRPEEVAGALAELREATAAGLHAAGFFSYELGYVLEPKLAALLPDNRRVPLLWFGVYSEPRSMTGAEVQNWLTAEAIGNPSLGALAHTWDATAYLERFEEVQNKIRSGDIYQLNLTFKAKFNLQGSPLALYRDLRLKPVSYTHLTLPTIYSV